MAEDQAKTPEERAESLARLTALLLDDPNADVRGLTAVAFGKLPADEALGPLLHALDDPDERVRIAVARSLGEVGDERAVSALVPLLQAENPEQRAAVVVALSQIADESAFAPVVVCLFDADDEVRRNAAAAMGKLGDPRAFEPLVECLGDSYHWVRANAAWSLGQLRIEDAYLPLIAAFKDEDDEDVAANIIVALSRLSARAATECVLLTMGSAREKLKVRVAAAMSFPECAADASQVLRGRTTLIEMLGGAVEDELRATAAWALGRLSYDPAAENALQTALNDPYEWVRRYSQESLDIFSANM